MHALTIAIIQQIIIPKLRLRMKMAAVMVAMTAVVKQDTFLQNLRQTRKPFVEKLGSFNKARVILPYFLSIVYYLEIYVFFIFKSNTQFLKQLYAYFLLLSLVFCACQKPKQISTKTDEDYEKADSFLNIKPDSAFYYYNKVVTNSKDSLLIARAYNGMAVIQSDAGDYFGSQQSLLLSIPFLDEQKESDRLCVISDYNELGSTSLRLKNYDAALGYYDHALKFSTEKDFKGIVQNNKAVAYKKKKEYDKAIEIYRSIIDRSKNNKREYARILSNLAFARWLEDSNYHAAADLHTALQIREKEKDKVGLVASFSQLSDYYYRFHPDSALIYSSKLYEVALEINNPDDELEALQKLIQLGSTSNLKGYFTRYEYLNDSIQTSRNSAKNQFALIRFDSEKNKTDNLRLQKENTEKKNQILLLFLVVFVLSVSAFNIILRSKRRKQRMEQEYQNNLRESKLKTSKKVHDVVANGLYQLMSKIEYNTIEKEQLLDEIETLYENSRDISYEQPIINRVDFHEEIQQLLTSFSTPEVKVLLTGNEKDLWNNVSEEAKYELKHVLQELMVNMKKHSSAQNVVVKFEQENGNLHIQYTDDGIGLQGELKKGNGLTNTGTRIIDIGGKLIFDSQRTTGLRIHIYIPIA